MINEKSIYIYIYYTRVYLQIKANQFITYLFENKSESGEVSANCGQGEIFPRRVSYFPWHPLKW